MPLLIGLTVILVAGECGIYFFTRSLLIRDFEAALRSAEPEVFGTIRDQMMERFVNGNEMQFQLRDTLMKTAAYVEVWTSDGGVVGRSASLDGADIPFPGPPPAEQTFWKDVTLPNGLRAHALVTIFRPLPDEGNPLVSSQQNPPVPDEANRERMEMAKLLQRLPVSMIVLIARDRSELDGTLRRLSLVLWTAGTTMLLVTTMVVMLVSRRGLAPLHKVADQADQIDAAKLHFRFGTAGLPSELRSICERLNDLLSRLEASFTRERCFSADVAHELRTPITELRSLAEIALKWPSDDPAVSGAFRDTLESALQMQGVVDGLLAIARCEADTQPVSDEPVDLVELICKIWQPFEARASSAGLAVGLELPDRAPVKTDRAMLGLILVNLFSNAVEYTPPSGLLEIRLRVKESGFDLTVNNTVEDLAPEEVSHFFERFWRRDTVRTSSEHSGIGLAVSQAYAGKLGLALNARLTGETMLEMRLSRHGVDRSTADRRGVDDCCAQSSPNGASSWSPASRITNDDSISSIIGEAPGK